MKKPLIANISTLLLILVFNFQSSFAQVNLTLTGGVFPTGNPIMGITYGNGVYVSIGYNGYILRSTDGNNWTVAKNSSWLNVTYSKVCYGNGLFVGVSTGGHIVTSPDGSNWTQQTSPTSSNISDVQYLNGNYYIVGSNNTAYSSADGITWTSFSIGAGGTDYLTNIFYAGSKLYIGARSSTNDSRCYSSTTGATGTWSSTLINSNGGLNKLVYLNNRFFALNSTPSVYSSTDGTSWAVAGGTRLAAPNQVFTAFYDGLTYFLLGNSTDFGYCSVFTSLDGINFSLQPQAVSLTVQHAAYLNGKYFLVGNEGLVSATNGANWVFASTNLNAVATDGTNYVAVGQNTSNEAGIQLSTDFVNWTTVLPGIIKPLNGITYGGGKFVAVGNTNSLGKSTFAVSTDGLVWTTGATTYADNLRAVAYGNSKYVAVGLNGRILYSSTGLLWTSAEAVTGYHYYGVSYVNGYFVAVGGSTLVNGMVKVKYSADGVSWTDASPSVAGQFHSICYGGGKYMLVGRDNVSGSQKFFSMTTTDITSSATYSATATISTPEGELGTIGYGAVSFNNSTFTALANLRVAPFSAYVLTSTNATSWTATAVGSTTRLRSIVSMGSSFRAIGGSPSGYLKISIGATLPLKLVSFTGRENGGYANLEWKATDELNTDHFEVEASDDGQRFHHIGSVVAKNAPGTNAYNYTDPAKLSGSRYYRLRMFDRDGKSTYSQHIRLESKATMKTLSIYPNPAASSITISLPSSEKSTLVIYNSKGERLISQELQGSQPSMNITSLAPGVYVLQVTQGGTTFSERMIRK